MGRGGSVHCRMLLIEEHWKAYRVFCWARHTYKRSIFPAWCSHLSKTKQNAKTALVQLAFPINAHQNAKCACILGAVYTSIPSYLPDPPFRFCRGSGSKTKVYTSSVYPLTCVMTWIHSKNRIVTLTICLSCLLQMSEPIWCTDTVNCQDGMIIWRKVGWEWGKDCHVVLLHMVMNCVHSSESEMANCQLLWQFLLYSVVSHG